MLASEYEIQNPFYNNKMIIPSLMNNHLDTEQEKRVTEYESNIAKEKAMNRFMNSGIFGKMQNYTFNNYQVNTEEQEKFVKDCQNVLIDIFKGKFRFVCLLGKYGVGKTHLAISMLRQTCGKVKKYYNNLKELPIYYSVRYGLSDEFCKQYNECRSFSSKISQKSFIEDLSHYDLLCIDEIGRSDKGQDEQEFLFKLLDARYVLKKSTILISNYNLEDFKKCLGGALSDRLNSCGVYPVINNIKSYREKEFC